MLHRLPCILLRVGGKSFGRKAKGGKKDKITLRNSGVLLRRTENNGKEVEHTLKRRNALFNSFKIGDLELGEILLLLG